MTTETNHSKDYAPNELLRKKRDGLSLSSKEVKWFIDGLDGGYVDDKQMSAFLMASFIRGLNKEETAALTDSMLNSGKVFNFSDPKVIDKHSTGGVGDKTSFILAPIAAACGVKVPMISGRGLGHTGGTVDKMESIPGFNTQVPLDTFEEQLKKYDWVMSGQTKEIAPADKVLYGLRDITGTVESIPLITASIMSKKLAEGASGFVMDVKTGSGAFMETREKALELAESLGETALRFDKNMLTLITDMSQPLGNYIGNSLEIIEVIKTLKGDGPEDLTEISLQLAAGMIFLAGICKTEQEAYEMAKETLDNGKAFEKFKENVLLQGGDVSYIENPDKFEIASKQTEIFAQKDGYLNSMDCKQIGLFVVMLGGGRYQYDDVVDPRVGIKMNKKCGDQVVKGESICTLFHHPEQQNIIEKIQEICLKDVFNIDDQKLENYPELILEKKLFKAQRSHL